MDQSTTHAIQDRLSHIEKSEKVTVLYACESGSRAWGFESMDSDYDVRFIYLRKTHDYLSISRGKSVIERPIDNGLDLSGWDLVKALELFCKSNPPLMEWLQSPIVYRSISSLVKRLTGLMPRFYSPRTCMYHYLHIAESNFRRYLKEEEVWTKKYFYVLRPLLACLWIERDLGTVPTELHKLVNTVVTDSELREAIETLLSAKKNGEELGRGPRNEIISSFMEEHIVRLSGKGQRKADAVVITTLDNLFLDILTEVNGNGIRQDRHPFESLKNPRDNGTFKKNTQCQTKITVMPVSCAVASPAKDSRVDGHGPSFHRVRHVLQSET